MTGPREILFETKGGVATLTLNRPEALNALTVTMMDEIVDALGKMVRDGSARALLVTGAGRGFCAGQDLKTIQDPSGPDVRDMAERHYLPVFQAIRALPMPVIAAVNGMAAGGGFSIALACDIVLAARSAQFIQVFSRIGIIPDLGSTYLLPRLVGRARALSMMMTNDPIDAAQAEDWGIIYKCVDDDDLMAEATALAARLAEGPTKALALTRRAVDVGEHNTFDEQFRHELAVQIETLASHDATEGIRAFVDKRKARFRGN